MMNANVVTFPYNNQDKHLREVNEKVEEKRKEQIRKDLTKGYLKMLSNYYA
ncbi:hypothetical protein M3649_03950 [Ureibacillus chungkukjangi]|uniref:hypothetical protein n=1 Tax=Ureibacillus chungkukjangi TaxID=1202712 RepID=UPI0020419974|nr:hypothetical protein [Ureibacillus chungkukjangi]MCM3387285.1 hypothetical protein [Ureibacillus chungkukjangi]